MISLVVFLLGLAVGSFLNVVIYRLPARRSLGEGGEKGESALQGRSYCPHCKHTLFWQDLVPLLSFVLLRGKCRYCKKLISWQYPLVELATAFLFVVIFNFQLSIFSEFSILQFSNLLYLWAIGSLLIIIFVYDLKHYLIPDKILYPAIGLVFLWWLFEVWSLSHWNLIENWKLVIENSLPLTQAILAGFLASLFFWTIHILSNGRAMGFGDVKLAFFMGLFLGWPNILVALFVAFLLGAAVGVALILTHKKHLKSQVPFGPFLIIGTFAAVLWGNTLVDWYLGLLV